jgi:hypothetical protein
MDAAGRVLGEAFGDTILGTYTRDEIGLTKTLSFQKGQNPLLFGLASLATSTAPPPS